MVAPDPAVVAAAPPQPPSQPGMPLQRHPAAPPRFLASARFSAPANCSWVGRLRDRPRQSAAASAGLVSRNARYASKRRHRCRGAAHPASLNAAVDGAGGESATGFRTGVDHRSWRLRPSRSGSSASGRFASALKSAPARSWPRASPSPARRGAAARGRPHAAVCRRRESGRDRRGGALARRRPARRPGLHRAHRARRAARPRSSSTAATRRSAPAARCSPAPRATARRSTSSRSASRPSTTPSGRARPRTTLDELALAVHRREGQVAA